jgi:hypothetical protein
MRENTIGKVIEITPDMIEAGAIVFREVASLEFGTPESAVSEIVRAVLGSLVNVPDVYP